MASLFPWDHLVWRQWQVHYSRIDTHHTNENTSIHLSRHTHTKIQSQKQGHKASAVSKITTDAHLYAALSRPPLYQILQQTCAAALWDGPQKNNNISYLFKQQPYTTLLLLYDLWLSFVYNNGEHDVFVPQQKVFGPFTVHSNGFLQWWQWFFSNFNSTVLEDAWVWLIERYARDILLKITVEWNELMSYTSKCMVKIMELPDKHFNFVLNILKHLSSKPSTSSPPTWLLMSTHFILRPPNYYFDHKQIFRRTCWQPLVVETQCNHKTKAAYMLLKWKEQVR